MTTVLASVLLLTIGCTAKVEPVFTAGEFQTDRPKQLGSVVLCVTEAMRDYRGTSADPLALHEWECTLGPALIDAFKYSLESRVHTALISLGEPRFPSRRAQLFVVPAVVKFEATEPVIVRIEEYHVYLDVRVNVYDGKGRELMSKTYSSHGRKGGELSLESAGHAAHPMAAKVAIRQIVDEATNDVVALLTP